MSTSEFMKEAELIGFKCDDYNDYISVNGQDDLIVAKVNKKKTFGIDTDYVIFHSLNENDKEKLFKLLTDYASTPVYKRSV